MQKDADKRFCVYTHNDSLGNIRYVGSGVKARANKTYAKSGRGIKYQQYVELNGKLIVNIIQDGLTKIEAILLEIELYEKYKSHQLLNIRKPCKISDLLPKEYLNSLLYYDENSPSGLRWKITKTRRVIKGNVAGKLKNSGYWSVQINNKTYLAHRLIAIICGLNLTKDSFVDHIDRNRGNNCIKNLRIVTNAENSRNLSVDKNRREFPVGVTFTKCNNCFVAYISDPSIQTVSGTNKLIQVRFNVKTHGYDQALKLAINERERMLSELEERLNIVYSESHK
jgi:hypothetical protein